MMHVFLDDRPWFRAKHYGIGAGLPIAWQGWAMLAAHIALVMGLVSLLRGDRAAMIILVLLAAVAPLPLYRARTEGGWHWRWGDRGDRKSDRGKPRK